MTPKTKFPAPPIFLEGEPRGRHSDPAHIAWFAKLPPDKHAAWCKMYSDWYQEAYGWLPQPMARTKILDVEKKKPGSARKAAPKKEKPELFKQEEMF